MTQGVDRDGNLVDLTAEDLLDLVEMNLQVAQHGMVTEIGREALIRVRAQLPEIDTIKEAKFLAMLWPMLDTASASAEMLLARDIYLYAKNKMTQAETATLTQLDAYDPETDTNWPS